MKGFDKRGIEKFFKSRLDNVDKNSGDWSTPPNFVFEKAIDTIDKRQKTKKNRLIIAFLLFSFIALLTTIIITQNHQINDVQKSLKEIESKLIANQEKSTFDSKPQDIADGNISQDIIVDRMDSSVGSVSQEATPIHKNQQSDFLISKEARTSVAKDPSVETDTYNQPTVSPSVNLNLGSTTKSTADFNSSNGVTSIIPPTNQITLNHNSKNNASFKSVFLDKEPVNNVDGSYLNQGKAGQSILNQKADAPSITFPTLVRISDWGLTFRSEKISKVPVLAVVNNETSNERGLYFGLSTGPNFSSFSMTNMTAEASKSLVDYDKSCTGFYVEPGLFYQVNSRWSAGLILQYNRTNNNSQFNQSSSVDHQMMSFVNNKIEYSMPMEIMTPVGSHTMTSRIVFEENEPISDVISSSSDITQHLSTIGIGLSGRYSLINTERFNAYAGISLGYHFIQTVTSDFETTIEMDGKVKKQFNTVPQDMAKSHQNYASLSGLVGIEYKLNNKISLTFNGSFGRSLNSLHIINIETDPNTYLKTINTGIGMTYNLRPKFR